MKNYKEIIQSYLVVNVASSKQAELKESVNTIQLCNDIAEEYFKPILSLETLIAGEKWELKLGTDIKNPDYTFIIAK